MTVTALRDFGTYLYLGILAILGSITIGQFSQLTAAGGTVNQAVQGVIFNIQDIVKRCSYAYETVKLMEYPPYLQKGTRKVEDLKNPHEIEFRNVSFSYPNTGVQVLKNVSIKIKAGERLSVVGLNGAGKTTFIKLLCRLYDTDEGEILLDGVNIRDYDYDEYMKLFSVVFQDFRLLAFSVQENVLLGREDTPEAVDSVLEKVGLLDKVNTLPHGRDTMMFRQFEKDGVQLSGGEQQKLAIARALFKNARWLYSTSLQRRSTRWRSTRYTAGSTSLSAAKRRCTSRTGCPAASSATVSRYSPTARSRSSAHTTSLYTNPAVSTPRCSRLRRSITFKKFGTVR